MKKFIFAIFFACMAFQGSACSMGLRADTVEQPTPGIEKISIYPTKHEPIQRVMFWLAVTSVTIGLGIMAFVVIRVETLGLSSRGIFRKNYKYARAGVLLTLSGVTILFLTSWVVALLVSIIAIIFYRQTQEVFNSTPYTF